MIRHIIALALMAAPAHACILEPCNDYVPGGPIVHYEQQPATPSLDAATQNYNATQPAAEYILQLRQEVDRMQYQLDTMGCHSYMPSCRDRPALRWR